MAADTGKLQRKAYCQNRNALLEAMSLGGRQDFDTPFVSSGKSLSITVNFGLPKSLGITRHGDLN